MFILGVDGASFLSLLIDLCCLNNKVHCILNFTETQFLFLPPFWSFLYKSIEFRVWLVFFSFQFNFYLICHICFAFFGQNLSSLCRNSGLLHNCCLLFLIVRQLDYNLERLNLLGCLWWDMTPLCRICYIMYSTRPICYKYLILFTGFINLVKNMLTILPKHSFL